MMQLAGCPPTEFACPGGMKDHFGHDQQETDE